MAINLSLSKDDLKFGNGITGKVDIDLKGQDPTKPLNPSTASLFTASFSAAGGSKFAFGPQGSLNLSIDAGASVDFVPFWKDDSTLSDHGISSYLSAHTDQFILAFDIAAHAKASL